MIPRKIINRLKKEVPGNKPDFIIVGAQKAGTSSLYYYLSQHPNIIGSVPKELHYFDREIYHGRNLSWYHNHFRSISLSKKVYFESTPSYLYHKDVARNLSRNYPNIKLIVMLRNPIRRAFSAWNMYKDFFEKGMSSQFRDREITPGVKNPLYNYMMEGRSSFPSFRESIQIEQDIIENDGSKEPSILRRGLYAQQLESYYEFFNKEDILIIGFEDFVKKLEETLNMVYEFLGVKKSSFNSVKKEVRNKREYSVQLGATEEDILMDFYKDANQRLFDLLGYKPNW